MEFRSDVEIRQQLANYLNGEITLDEFQHWFVPRSWNFDQDSSGSLRNLVSAIELALAEFSNRDWTKDELRSQLGILLNNYQAEYGPFDAGQNALSIRTGAISSALVFRLIDLSPTFDTPRVEVCA